MKKIHDYEELLQFINKEEYALLYTSAPNCGVCYADLPKIEQIVKDTNIPSSHISISEIPMARGQLNLFSAPTVILFYQGKEFHRQVRIIDFNELLYRIEQIKNNK